MIIFIENRDAGPIRQLLRDAASAAKVPAPTLSEAYARAANEIEREMSGFLYQQYLRDKDAPPATPAKQNAPESKRRASKFKQPRAYKSLRRERRR